MSKQTMQHYLQDLEQQIEETSPDNIGEKADLVAARDRVKTELERGELH